MIKDCCGTCVFFEYGECELFDGKSFDSTECELLDKLKSFKVKREDDPPCDSFELIDEEVCR